MNVSTVADIQAGVKFAREQQVRLVIKNTGHDMSGKSLGGGSLSIWTHVSIFGCEIVEADSPKST